VLAVGEAVAVEALVAWLWEGPSAARVVGVEVQEIEVAALQPPAGFSTG
jgi:acylphosphatase